jgi:hypothetical protein
MQEAEMVALGREIARQGRAGEWLLGHHYREEAKRLRK